MKPEIDSVGVAILKGAYNAESKDITIDLSQFVLTELLGERVPELAAEWERASRRSFLAF